MMDYLFALVAITGLTVFLGIIVWHVPEPDLVTVLGVVVLMAAFDFARELWKKGRK